MFWDTELFRSNSIVNYSKRLTFHFPSSFLKHENYQYYGKINGKLLYKPEIILDITHKLNFAHNSFWIVFIFYNFN